jgi:hypothetical protein
MYTGAAFEIALLGNEFPAEGTFEEKAPVLVLLERVQRGPAIGGTREARTKSP